jgi:hypothetical protein
MEKDRLLDKEDKVFYSYHTNDKRLCIDDVFVQIGEFGK